MAADLWPIDWQPVRPVRSFYTRPDYVGSGPKNADKNQVQSLNQMLLNRLGRLSVLSLETVDLESFQRLFCT